MEFVLIAVAHFVALLSPGPDFFLILQTALAMRLKYAISVCAGIATANGLYISIAVLGLESVRHMQPLMLTLQYMGSAYLIYIGIMLLKARSRKKSGQQAVSTLRKESITHQFCIGFMSALLNPKNIIFYLSLFTAMVSVKTPTATRALYGLWMVGIVFGWDVGVASVLGNDRTKAVFNRFLFGVEKFSGAMLTLFGLMFCFR